MQLLTRLNWYVANWGGGGGCVWGNSATHQPRPSYTGIGRGQLGSI